MKNYKYIIIGLLLAALLLFASTAHATQFIATAYDLSPQSCGKHKDHPHYGITASGFNLTGHTWQSARVISADLSVLPLHTKVKINFPAPYEYMDGIYTVKDTGGGIHRHHIDIFMGENAHAEAIKFGRRHVIVTVL